MSMHTVTDGDRILLSGCSFILIPLGLIVLAFYLLRPILQPYFESLDKPQPAASAPSNAPPTTAESPQGAPAL